MTLSRKEMDAALKEKFVSKLRERGFKGSYPHFRREGARHIEIIGIQFSQWGGQFYIEIGLGNKDGEEVQGRHIPASKLKYYEVWPRERLGEIPFDYERDGVEVAASKASELPDEIERWFKEKSN